MMVCLNALSDMPRLKVVLLSYLPLGVTDTIHHFHAAAVLDHGTAIHAAIIGTVLVPIAIIAVTMYAKIRSQALLSLFLAIAILAIAVPGLYYGGWNHSLKVLAYLRIDTPDTNITSLFPAGNVGLWFYEITGLFEFVFAIACSYFVYLFLTKPQN